MAMNEREIALVSAAKAGDSKAFEDLYNHYYGKIFALARMTVKNDANAEDILQDTFISAWKNLNTLANPAAFNTWLQKIALNQCYSLLRKKNITIQMDEESDIEDFIEEPSNELLPSIYAERDDLRIRLGKIIDGLSDIQKQTVVLYYFNEQKVEEIAYIMDCNVGTVKKRLFLARKAIRTEVEEEERKSGEKFYGIAGIPMLPIGSLLAQQFESQVLATEVYATILATVTEAISGAGIAIEATAGASSGFVGSTATGVACGTSSVATGSAATGLSLSAKVMIGIAAAVVCVGVGIGGAYLVDNIITSDRELPEVEDAMIIGKPENDITSTPEPVLTPEPVPKPEPVPTPEPEDTITEAWFDAYREFVLNELYLPIIKDRPSGEQSMFDGYTSFLLYDLDGDGIPELIVLYSGGYGGDGAGAGVRHFFTCINDEVVRIGMDYDLGRYFSNTDAGFSGLFKTISMGETYAFYLEIVNREIVITRILYSDESLRVIERTDNDALYEAFSAAVEETRDGLIAKNDNLLPEFIMLEDIRQMGWDEFVNSLVGLW